MTAMNDRQLWQHTPETFQLQLDRAGCVANFREPAAGLGKWRVDGQTPLKGFHPLGVEFGESSPHSAADSYVRGGDAVVTYPDQPAAEMRSQVYWRAATHELRGALCAVELVVSVQTSRLDSCPRIRTCSSAYVSETQQLTDYAELSLVGGSSAVPPAAQAPSNADLRAVRCYMLRLAEAPYTYIEMIHSADLGETDLDVSRATEPHQATLRHSLFGDQLEKGVILRARVLGVLVDRAGDDNAAAAHCAAFAASHLPLTT